MKIKKIKAIRVLDSRDYPTIKTFVYTTNGIVGSAIVPSGTSTGSNEALELRDKTKAFDGHDVTKAINNVNTKINSLLAGFSVLDQEKIDKALIKLDGTANKSNLGANAMLSVSLAVARTASLEQKIDLWKYISKLNKTKTNKKLPIPLVNILNGGEHAGNNLDFQEFQIIPLQKSFDKRIEAVSEIYYKLKELLIKKFGKSAINVGYEGGFAPDISEPAEALDLLVQAINKAGYKNSVKLGLDCAANYFYNSKTKRYTINKKQYSSDELIKYYQNLFKKYAIISIEDPFSEDD
ncbi:MAG: phosphopyruvate hydratase, partial [archaeon]